MTTRLTPQAELIVDARNATGESPVWSIAEQALYWSDIPACRLYRWTPAGSVTMFQTPEMVGCFALTADGGFIAGMQSGIFKLELLPDTGLPSAASAIAINTKLLQPFTHAYPAMRANDGRCDRQGRFIVSTMLLAMPAEPRAGMLWSYETDARPENALRPIASDLNVPNGLAFSPDGKRIYHSDTHKSRPTVWVGDYDTELGTIANRKIFADFSLFPGRPDGAAMDVDGCYWVCGNDAGLIHRFTPSGKLDKSLAVPVKKPAMCSFGGSDLKTLFVTSIRPVGIDLSDQPLAGGLFALQAGVAGVPESHFGKSGRG